MRGGRPVVRQSRGTKGSGGGLKEVGRSEGAGAERGCRGKARRRKRAREEGGECERAETAQNMPRAQSGVYFSRVVASN